MQRFTRGQHGRFFRLFVLIASGSLALFLVWLFMAGGARASARIAPDDTINIEFYYAGNDPSGAAAAADDFASLLSVQTGHDVYASIQTCEGIIINHLGTGQADIGTMSGLAYAFGRNSYSLEAKLVNGMLHSFFYRGQINVQAAIGYEDIWDLQGLRFAATEPNSMSGYMFPYLLISDTTGMAPENFFSEVHFVGGHNQVIRDVYTGTVECGATFQDARTLVLEEYPDVMDVVSVLAVTEDIYQDPWAFRPGIDAQVVQSLTEGIIAVASTMEGENALEAIFEYDLTGMDTVDGSAYDPYWDLIVAFDLQLEHCYKLHLPVLVKD